jgi:signal transduction histidine kinase
MAVGSETTDDDASRLLAEASHELRGGAARLALMAEALAEHGLIGTGDLRMESRLRALASEGRRVQALASTLLDVARLTADGRQLDPVPVDLAALVEGVVAAEQLAPDREVTVRVAGDLKVWADPLALDQVVSNLVGNAFRHGGSHIVVEGRAEDGRVVVSVSDDGPGLPPGRAATMAAPSSSGLDGGLGLSIAAQLVTLLDGELRYDPDAAGGAHFTVTLPSA